MTPWQTNEPDAAYTLFSWVVAPAAAGNMTVSAPPAAATGQSGTVTVDWTDLNAGTKYLGAVVHTTPAGEQLTLVRVDTDAPGSASATGSGVGRKILLPTPEH